MVVVWGVEGELEVRILWLRGGFGGLNGGLWLLGGPGWEGRYIFGGDVNGGGELTAGAW